MSYIKVGTELMEDKSCEFLLWAPHASSVDLKFISPEEFSVNMERMDKGYWRQNVDGISPGCRYYYLLDGEILRPDPASAFQPEGVHGPSEIIDHRNFVWNDSKWRVPPPGKMIFYEIHTGTFTREGTFDAIVSLLPELKEFGITTIELMPVAQFPGERNWGYDGVYPYAVQNSYGGPAGLKRLCDACHRNGLALFLDVVYNHLGPEGNYLSAFGPYFTDKYRTPWGNAVNYDGEYSGGVRNYFIMNALYWFENYHVDGLRLDAVHGIYDHSARHILGELSDTVRSYSDSKGRHFYLVAESDLNDSRIVRSRSKGGYAIDAQWSDDFHHSIHTLLTGEKDGYYEDFGDIAHLAKAFTDGYIYSGEFSEFRKRPHGNSSKEIPAERMIVFIQDHDQIGNRMFGDRLISIAGAEAQKLAAGTLMIAPYVPLLFMGEEYGETAPFLYFVSHGDPGLAEAVREGRKKEFASFGWSDEPPDPQSSGTFEASRPDRKLICMAEHAAIYRYYRELIRIRRRIPAIRNLSKKNLTAEITGDGKILIIRRKLKGSEIAAMMNYSSREKLVITGHKGIHYQMIIDSADTEWNGPGKSAPSEIKNKTEILLKPYNFIIYSAAGNS